MPLFYAKLDRTNDTESGQNVQSKLDRKETSHAIKELKENTPDRTQSRACVWWHTEPQTNTRDVFDHKLRSNTIPYVGSGRK